MKKHKYSQNISRVVSLGRIYKMYPEWCPLVGFIKCIQSGVPW